MANLFRISGCILLVALVGIPNLVAQRPNQHANFLPQETIAAICVMDSKRWQEQWNRTGLGKYFDNPAVQKYLRQVINKAQGEAAWLQLIMPGNHPVKIRGQFSYALLGAQTGFEHLVQLDCADGNAASDWIMALAERLVEQKYKTQRAAFHQTTMLIATSSTGDSTLAFTVIGNRALACTSPLVLKQLVSEQPRSLVKTAEFDATVYQALASGKQAHVWWFVRPLQLTLNDPQDKKNIDNYKMLQAQGFDAITAIGGSATIDPTTHRLQARGFAAVRPPFRRAARLLDFEETKLAKIPDWCAAATSCGYANLRTKQLLDNYSSLFDALYGEGETGIFSAVLDDLKQRNDGPQVDLQTELFALLKPRAYVATVQGEKSAPRVIALETEAPAKVRQAIKKLFEGDSRAIDQSADGHTTWKIMPLDDGYGIKEPFVVSMRDHLIFIAPNLAVIDYLVQSAKASKESFGVADGSAKFAYRIDFEKLAEGFFSQLNQNQFSKPTESFLARLKLKRAIMTADPSLLPPFDEVRKLFDSTFNVVGSGNGDQWRLSIETK